MLKVLRNQTDMPNPSN